ncbi:MerR family transcriptional regulator [Salinibacterium sp. ZJ450]|uniref:MerR family transcriptional regulator n=1 Tax=Salinibacterium sp. ZJ450 TaxID=2708338 RepID=UPI001CD79689|nr:MerR family transcriptional regulator [Salinibacterium sp. ZJ450]
MRTELEWSIQDVARLTGTTSRTLRHYDDIGLLEPTRVGGNGYRYYDADALTRLQRILLLRELGLGLPAIAEVLAGARSNDDALDTHLRWLQQEKLRIDRQINSVQTTILKLKGGEQLMAEEMFDGFDHTQYRDEVEQRWGKDADARSDSWWRSMSDAEKKEWQQRAQTLGADWQAAAQQGLAADSDEAQALAQRQFDWLRGIPGTPGGGTTGPTKEYFVGLAEMYVADERFAANYGGVAGASLVRDAMTVYAERNL